MKFERVCEIISYKFNIKKHTIIYKRIKQLLDCITNKIIVYKVCSYNWNTRVCIIYISAYIL